MSIYITSCYKPNSEWLSMCIVGPQLTRPLPVILCPTRRVECIKGDAFGDWDHVAIASSLTSCSMAINICSQVDERYCLKSCWKNSFGHGSWSNVSFWQDLPQCILLLKQMRSLVKLVNQPRVACTAQWVKGERVIVSTHDPKCHIFYNACNNVSPLLAR